MPDASAASIGAYSPQNREATNELTREIRSVSWNASGLVLIIWDKWGRLQSRQKRTLAIWESVNRSKHREPVTLAISAAVNLLYNWDSRQQVMHPSRVTYLDFTADCTGRWVHPDRALKDREGVGQLRAQISARIEFSQRSGSLLLPIDATVLLAWGRDGGHWREVEIVCGVRMRREERNASVTSLQFLKYKIESFHPHKNGRSDSHTIRVVDHTTYWINGSEESKNRSETHHSFRNSIRNQNEHWTLSESRNWNQLQRRSATASTNRIPDKLGSFCRRCTKKNSQSFLHVLRWNCTNICRKPPLEDLTVFFDSPECQLKGTMLYHGFKWSHWSCCNSVRVSTTPRFIPTLLFWFSTLPMQQGLLVHWFSFLLTG